MSKSFDLFRELIVREVNCFVEEDFNADLHEERSEYLKRNLLLWKSFKTNSPIEKLLFTQMIFDIEGYGIGTVEFSGGYFLNKWICIPQYKIGKYNADFCFIWEENNKIWKVAIECDGHNFHEKTKEQAAHDKKRDRYFTTKNIKLLRFTGSEIHNDSEHCVHEIGSLLHNMTHSEILPYIQNREDK